ncbi:bacteriohemerythrin [Dechloromonas sp. ZY10]|uniref:bacteriohemerythrin n=1 Tax=Dechloromonas aquae TaxID=2664436 RepID=UPI003528E8BB
MSVQSRLEWGEALMTGVPEIDEQHMILVHTLNEAAERLGRECSAEILGQITQDLLGYALYHFDTEEELMQQSGYSEQDAAMQALHLEQHRNFSAKVVSIRENLKAGVLITPDDLIAFLNQWLVDHIMNTDKKLAAFLLAGKAPSAG